MTEVGDEERRARHGSLRAGRRAGQPGHGTREHRTRGKVVRQADRRHGPLAVRHQGGMKLTGKNILL